MGLFKKKIKMPNQDDAFWIQQRLQELKYHNDVVLRGSNIEGFLNNINNLKTVVMELKKYERKYPDYFNPKPSEILNNFNTDNKPLLEKQFIDRYIESIERKLLDYSTNRGKQNNFNKKVDLFRYYSGEFEPQSIIYFENILNERFKQYL